MAVDQTVADATGNYNFNFTVDRLAGSYTIYTNYSSSDELITNQFVLKNTIPMMSVKIGDTDIKEIAQTNNGDELNISLSGFDLADDYPGLVIVAQYSGGMLKSAEYTPLTGGSSAFGDELNKKVKSTVIPDAEKIIIHYWNKNTYVPLTASYIID